MVIFSHSGGVKMVYMYTLKYSPGVVMVPCVQLIWIMSEVFTWIYALYTSEPELPSPWNVMSVPSWTNVGVSAVIVTGEHMVVVSSIIVAMMMRLVVFI